MIDEHKKSAWFVAGLGLGALAGLVLAPKSGRETREAIAAGVERGQKYVGSLGRNARKRMNDMAESGRKMFVRKKKQISAVVAVGRDRTKDGKDSDPSQTGTD